MVEDLEATTAILRLKLAAPSVETVTSSKVVPNVNSLFNNYDINGIRELSYSNPVIYDRLQDRLNDDDFCLKVLYKVFSPELSIFNPAHNSNINIPIDMARSFTSTLEATRNSPGEWPEKLDDIIFDWDLDDHVFS